MKARLFWQSNENSTAYFRVPCGYQQADGANLTWLQVKLRLVSESRRVFATDAPIIKSSQDDAQSYNNTNLVGI